MDKLWDTLMLVTQNYKKFIIKQHSYSMNLIRKIPLTFKEAIIYRKVGLYRLTNGRSLFFNRKLEFTNYNLLMLH